MEIFQRAAVATADVTLCIGRLRTLFETWPPAQNGYGVLTDAPAVLNSGKGSSHRPHGGARDASENTVAGQRRLRGSPRGEGDSAEAEATLMRTALDNRNTQ